MLIVANNQLVFVVAVSFDKGRLPIYAQVFEIEKLQTHHTQAERECDTEVCYAFRFIQLTTYSTHVYRLSGIRSKKFTFRQWSKA